MSNGLVRFLVVAGLALAVAGLAMGCSDDGGGELSIEDYFEKLEALDDEQQAASDELDKELDDLGDDVSTDAFADTFEKQVKLLETFADDVDDLDPPAEVKDAHDRVVSGLRGARDQFDTIIETIRDADSVDEAFNSLDDAAFSEIEKATEACRELETIAADHNIEVDFDCDDE